MPPPQTRRTKPWLWALFAFGMIAALVGILLWQLVGGAGVRPFGQVLFFVGVAAVLTFSVLRGGWRDRS